MSSPDTVLYQQTAGIARIALNRPEALNALNSDLLQALAALLDRIREDGAVKAAIVAGGGKAFCAGADIAYLRQASPLAVREFARRGIAVNERIETLGKPVIAAIDGYALGGGLELAEACWLRVAAKSAQIGHPEVRIGAVTGRVRGHDALAATGRARAGGGTAVARSDGDRRRSAEHRPGPWRGGTRRIARRRRSDGARSAGAIAHGRSADLGNAASRLEFVCPSGKPA